MHPSEPYRLFVIALYRAFRGNEPLRQPPRKNARPYEGRWIRDSHHRGKRCDYGAINTQRKRTRGDVPADTARCDKIVCRFYGKTLKNLDFLLVSTLRVRMKNGIIMGKYSQSARLSDN